jgi:hypothetical protein
MKEKKPGKFLIFDAGPVISLTMNGLLPILEKLKQIFSGEFIITPDVERELIDKPLKIKKYELEGVKVRNLVEKGILKKSSQFVPNNTLTKETREIMNVINSSFKAETTNEKIKLIHEGEASCLAFSKLCKTENVIVVDERTVRMFIESPENLKKLMEKKLNTKIKTNIKKLANYKFIRSAELLYIAYKKNLFTIKKDKTLLDALLYGVKYKGASISSKEIEQIKKLD